ncbi:hypothetical protein PybrP1_006763 [[Pythium] brassicae (nom. inval.)]|nr:hypothetical protein PybrP1_006763 [[Pythium] brassicae (nom. inval.)]
MATAALFAVLGAPLVNAEVAGVEVVETAEIADATAGGRNLRLKKQQQQQQPKPKATTTSSHPPPPPPPLVGLFDFDCNLTHDDLTPLALDAMVRAAAAGVSEMLVPGATLDESRAALTLSRDHPHTLFATAGVHPYNAHAAPETHELEELEALAVLPECRAVGECGLDYSPGFPPAEPQREWFRAQLELACRLRQPLFLHERLAHDDFVATVASCQARFGDAFPPAVVHCFTGTERELRAYVARGFYIGVTGFVCRKELGAPLREMLRLVPLQRLVIETDAPYMGFPKCRGREPTDPKKQYPNVPSALPLVAETVAAALGLTAQEVATATRANARRFLRLSV